MSIKKTFLLAFILTLIIVPVLAFAQSGDIEGLLKDAAGSQGAGYNTAIDSQTGIATFAGLIVRTFLSLTGLIFMIYIVYGGFLWLTSGGNEEKMTKAKSIIRNGIIGLIVIFSAAAIYMLIRTALGSGSDAPTGSST